MCTIEMSSGETPGVYYNICLMETHQVCTIEMSSGETPGVYNRDEQWRDTRCVS